MSRFTNLEFESKEQKKKAAEQSKQSEHVLDQNRTDSYYLAQAEQLFRQGKFEPALRAYSRALELNTEVLAAWFGQVRILIELDELKEAVIWSDKALEKYKDHPQLLSAKALAYARMNSLSKAMALSDAVVKMPGNDPFVWFARGNVLLSGGEKNCEHCFWKAAYATEKSQAWFIHLCIGRSYRYHRKFNLALRSLQKALETQTSSAFLWCEMGCCQLSLGLKNAAIASFRHAIELDAAYTEAKEGLSAAQNITLWQRIFRWCNLLFAIFWLLTGCNPKAPASPPSAPRIIATYSPAMELIFALRLHPYLIGIPQNTQQVPVYRTLRPDIDKLTVVGSKLNGINMETVLSLNPSLVIMFLVADAERNRQKLLQFGIACEVVNMESVSDIKESLRSLAVALRVSERAHAVTAEMDRLLQLVSSRLEQHPSVQPMKVYFAANRSLLTTHSQTMLQHEMILRAGARDVVDVQIGGWVVVSAEQLMEWNPHIIVTSQQAVYTVEAIMRDSRFAQLAAIKTGKVYRIPDAVMPWDFPGPDVALGILWLALLCHPHLFQDIDIDAEKEHFYQAVYGLSYRSLSTSDKSDRLKK
jgi:iron complex transport system substrate-binding protein